MPELQAALAYVSGLMAECKPDDPKLVSLGQIFGLLQGYHERYRSSDWEPVEVDKYYEAPLWNPETKQKSRTFSLGMLLDLMALASDKRILVDHKTTSSDIADPNADYWRQLIIEGQLSHYLYILWLNGLKADAAVWDVVRKPAISPRQLNSGEKKQLQNDGTWFGVKIDETNAQECLATGRENIALYSLRVANDCSKERPEHYFQRRQIPRLDAEIMDYAREVWEHGQELVTLRRTERHVRNSGACILYGGACEFLSLCSGHDDLNSDRWQRKQQVHSELPIVTGDGRNILTTSRVRCYQTCRRKHYLQYELGIERADAEEKKSLWFGSVWHRALAIYFKTKQENQNGHASFAESGSGLDSGNCETEAVAQ